MTQWSRESRGYVITKDTSYPTRVYHEGPDWKPDGPPEWDLVFYGKDWVEWDDMPGVEFYTDYDKAFDGSPPQKFRFYDAASFRSIIYDKTIHTMNSIQWMGYWDHSLHARVLTGGFTDGLVWAYDKSSVTLTESYWAKTTIEAK